jgi:hypothetical protein
MEIFEINKKISENIDKIKPSASKTPTWVIGAILGTGLVLSSCNTEKRKTTPEEKHYNEQQKKQGGQNQGGQNKSVKKPKPYEPRPSVPPPRALYGV